MDEPKLKASMCDYVGICELCKNAIRSKVSGYIQFYEYKDKKYHLECISKKYGNDIH